MIDSCHTCHSSHQSHQRHHWTSITELPSLNFHHKTMNWCFCKMGPHMKGKGAKHLLIKEKASILATKKLGGHKKYIFKAGLWQGHNQPYFFCFEGHTGQWHPLQKKGVWKAYEDHRGVGGPEDAAQKIPLHESWSAEANSAQAGLSDRLQSPICSPEASEHAKQGGCSQEPLLTKKMKKKRLAFCKQYKDWTAARAPGPGWEGPSAPTDSTANSWWKLWNTRILPWCGVAFWDMVGVGPLLPPQEYDKNGERYRPSSRTNWSRLWALQTSMHVLQDGTPCHINWPGNILDLNPTDWIGGFPY